MQSSISRSHVTFDPCMVGDFDELFEIRITAMRESLERLGRFDPIRARERLQRSFYPEHSEFILIGGARAGFYTLRPSEDGLHLEHFYLLPSFQSKGVGSRVLTQLTIRADSAGLPIFLGALRDSPANAFYARHGFELSSEGPWDLYYIYRPKGTPSPSTGA